MREMEMYYVDAKKEYTNKGVEALKELKIHQVLYTTKGPWQRTGIVLVLLSVVIIYRI